MSARRFVFVGGVPRSGTSLVQKILDLHPRIYAGPELGVLPQLMAAYDALAREIRAGKLDVVLGLERARASFRGLLASLYQDRVGDGVDYVSEKTPANLLVFEPLAEVFPDARFVWVVRDPRDVLLSLRKVHERGRARGVRVPMGASARRDLELIGRYLRAGEAFRRGAGGRLRVVHYEELLARPREVVAALCAWLGVEFEEGMLRTEARTDTSESIERNVQKHGLFYASEDFDRPIEADNVGRWRRELDGSAVRAAHVYFGRHRFDALARYELPEPGRLSVAREAVRAQLGRAVVAARRAVGG